MMVQEESGEIRLCDVSHIQIQEHCRRRDLSILFLKLFDQGLESKLDRGG